MKITKKKTRVGVLMGGLSSEREISLRSGKAIAKALKSLGYNIIPIDVKPSLPEQLKRARIQVAYNALHGRWGEDGCVQGLLEVMSIPYTGSGVTSSALGMDKAASKKIFSAVGLTTPSFVELLVPVKGAKAWIEKSRSPFGYPCVVKPSDEGSSVGTSVVKKPAEFKAAIRDAAKFSRHILVERYIAGREIAVAVLDDHALGTVEVKTRRQFYDYRAKYTKGETQYIIPAPLDKVTERRVMEEALRAALATGCRGVSRVDVILADGIEANVLEINTLPGMTELSLVPQIAAGQGLSFEKLCEMVLLGADLQHGGMRAA